MRQRVFEENEASRRGEDDPSSMNNFGFDGIEADPALERQLKEQKIKSIVRTALALVGGGLLLVVLGLIMYWEGRDQLDWLPPLILGVLCLIPGSYASFLAYGAHKRWPGYAWDALPGYEQVTE